MSALIHAFSAFGIFCLGCLILALAVAGLAFVGALLGASISASYKNGQEDPGAGLGGISGAIGGGMLTLYCMCAYGLATAFLTALGLGIAIAILAGLILLFSPPVQLPEDYPY